MILSLKRELATPDGTFGRLIFPLTWGNRWWYSMEDDWLDNAVEKSCIPLGIYVLKRTVYNKKKQLAVGLQDPYWISLNFETFEIMDVPGRDRILIHPANTEEDVKGCVGIGCTTGSKLVADEDDPNHPLVQKRAVLDSRKAFSQFMRAMKGADEAELRVTGVVG